MPTSSTGPPTRVLFEPDRPAFRAGEKLFAAAEKKEGARRLLHAAEQAVKVPAFDCRDCGDCSLPDIAFLCPESQCVKNQRNGPCGGTRDGKCEVGEKECIWARAYDRLKAYGEEEAMLERPVVYRNGHPRRDQRLGQHLPSGATTTPRTLRVRAGNSEAVPLKRSKRVPRTTPGRGRKNLSRKKKRMKLRDPDLDFIIIGENIHTTAGGDAPRQARDRRPRRPRSGAVTPPPRGNAATS